MEISGRTPKKQIPEIAYEERDWGISKGGKEAYISLGSFSGCFNLVNHVYFLHFCLCLAALGLLCCMGFL